MTQIERSNEIAELGRRGVAIPENSTDDQIHALFNKSANSPLTNRNNPRHRANVSDVVDGLIDDGAILPENREAVIAAFVGQAQTVLFEPGTPEHEATKPAAQALSQYNQTLKEYVAAGGLAENYPPVGYSVNTGVTGSSSTLPQFSQTLKRYVTNGGKAANYPPVGFSAKPEPAA